MDVVYEGDDESYIHVLALSTAENSIVCIYRTPIVAAQLEVLARIPHQDTNARNVRL